MLKSSLEFDKPEGAALPLRMQNMTLRRSLFVLIGLVFLIGLDTWLLVSSFERVVAQQASVRKTYRSIDQLASITSRLRDAEILARRYTDTDDDDINTLLGRYDDVEREAAVYSSMIDGDPVSVAVLRKFTDVLRERRSALRVLKHGRPKITLQDVTAHLREGDESYSQLASLLTKLKETQEHALQANLSPVSQYATWFYLAALVTALLNLIVGGLAYAQAEILKRRRERETLEFEMRARDMQESAAASEAVGGEMNATSFAAAIRSFFTKRFGAVAVNVYAVRDEALENIERQRPVAAATDARSENLMAGALKLTAPTIYREIPANDWRLHSEFVETSPRALLFVPLRFQGTEIGLIEVALLEDLTERSLERLSKLADIFAVSLHASESKKQTDQLLGRTIKQAAELQVQQEELRTNNEELENQARSLEIQQHALTQRNLEFETAQLQLERRAEDLTKANQHKSDFLAKMSHELRTPLNGLLILSDLLSENKEKTLTSQQERFAKSINSAGHDLLNLINDILDLSKIEARKLAVHPTEFSIGELFASKRRTFEPQTSAKGLTFVTDLSDDLKEVRLHTDRQRLDQILRNFLSNAVKFTEKGRVELSAEVNTANRIVTFSVKDSGIGIPAENQKLIFEAFEQADSAVSSKYGGTGLGLTIAKELAELLGGEIFLASQAGKGSEFKISIPLEYVAQDRSRVPDEVEKSANLDVEEESTQSETDESEAHAAVLAQLKERISQLDKSKKSILIVEDDERFRSVVAETVKKFGFEPIEIGDGTLAIELLNVFVPDAILLDIKIPGISGLGLLEMMKKSPGLRHIPVHMISGLEYQTNALRLGAFGYLTKPVTTEKITSALERIEGLLSRRLKKLLLIEDNAIQKEALTALFESSDLEVVTAETGRLALEKVTNEGFDCIVLDLTLPDVSGLDLLSELRNLEISLPPIVIYTGRDLSGEEQDYLRKYSESIVIKGARSPERLLDEVNLFLHRVDTSVSEDERRLISAYRVDNNAFGGRTILIVDDDVRNIFALTSALEAKGFKVHFAKDGAQALKIIEERPDIELVLMDIMMPVMDGLEAIRRIRANSDARIKTLPVIALTAKAMREDHEKCMEAGANDYLPKPINLENLTTVMKVWLSKPGSRFVT